MGMAHFALNQLYDGLHREDLEEEWLCLREWGSLLKERTTSEKERVAGKQKFLDKMEVLLNRKQIATGAPWL
jgi:hypothetical protein